jgi:hypothetical protein
MNNKLVWLVLIGAVLLLSKPKKKASSLSGLRRRKRKAMLGGIKGAIRIEDIEKEYGKRIPKKFRDNLKTYIGNPDVQSFLRKSLAYKLSDSDYKTLYKIGCHPDNKPKCKYPGLNYVSTIFIHPVTKWQVIAEKVDRLEKAIDREEAKKKQKGQMTLFGLGYMRPGADKDERQKQKEILKELYPDYYAPRHDVFVERYNKAEEAGKLKDYMANRGITKGQMTLFGLGKIDNCYKYFTMKGFGPTEACFHGESTYGKGTATFTATDTAGRIIPSMVSTKIMPFDKFYNLMEKNKAKMVS